MYDVNNSDLKDTDLSSLKNTIMLVQSILVFADMVQYHNLHTKWGPIDLKISKNPFNYGMLTLQLCLTLLKQFISTYVYTFYHI